MVPVHHHYFLKFCLLLILLWIGLKVYPAIKMYGSKTINNLHQEQKSPVTNYPFSGSQPQAVPAKSKTIQPGEYYKDLK